MRNIQHLLRLAREGIDGRDWYLNAQRVIHEITLQTNIPTVRLSQVLAITSPRCSVSRNVRVTKQYITQGSLPRDVIRSTRLALIHYEDTGEIRGQKTSAFARAILGDEDAIVLDTWMAEALGVEQKLFERKWMQSCANRRIRYGAYLVSLTPSQFQACVWTGIVRRHNRNVPDIARILREEFLNERY